MAHKSRTARELLDQKEWHRERKRLREILLDCGLTETIKWNKLCYAFEDGNVAIIYGLSQSCAVGFFKGSLIADPDHILEAPGKHSQAMRRIHFTGLDEIDEREALLRSLTKKAIEIEKQGREVDFDKGGAPDKPQELLDQFDKKPKLKTAFNALTPGRQRGYLLHFSAAKKSETRARRIEKYEQDILSGKGMHDR
jgi:uncharacterized protein YdeI (YjbR/CyaY-like superfamily)